MKKMTLVLLMAVLILFTGCSSNVKPDRPLNDSPPIIDNLAQVKIYLIAIGDQGNNGRRIETGDSLIPVERNITTPGVPLNGALNELFSIKERFDGESGLYNPLYQSTIRVESIKIDSGVAAIRLSGTMILRGSFDRLRAKAQIIETALQFPTVHKVEIYLNNKDLNSFLSVKG